MGIADRLAGTQWKSRAPKALSVVLLLALLADSASTVRDMVEIHRVDPRPTPRPARVPAPSRGSDISHIVQAHLFGVSPGGAGTEGIQPSAAPVTFRLTGTVAWEQDAHQGYAILGPSGGETRMVGAGASLAGGWRLSLVFPDQVVLERLGVQMNVLLPRARKGLAGKLREAVVVAAREDSAQEDDSPPPVETPGHHFWLGELRARPLVSGLQVRGYRLAPPKAIAQRLGLRPGDVATSLNGVALDSDETVARQLQNLGGTLSMTILRKGVTETVQVHLDDADRTVEDPP